MCVFIIVYEREYAIHVYELSMNMYRSVMFCQSLFTSVIKHPPTSNYQVYLGEVFYQISGVQHKVQVGMCVQRRFIPICTYTQSDRNRIFLTEEALNPWLSIGRQSKTLTRLRECDGHTCQLLHFASFTERKFLKVNVELKAGHNKIGPRCANKPVFVVPTKTITNLPSHRD